MVEEAQHIAVAQLAEAMDDLSTRLIIHGPDTIGPLDFENVAGLAAQRGWIELSATARRIASGQSLKQAAATAERSGAISSGIEELRRQLDRIQIHDATPKAAGQAPSQQKPFANATMTSLTADENLIREFITESNEHLATIESQLLILEKDNSAAEPLNAIFRGFHTIKGLAGFLDFTGLQVLTHEVETLLDLARTGKIAVDASAIDLLLECNDVARQELTAILYTLEGKIPAPSSVDAALLNRVRRAGCAAPESDRHGQLSPLPDRPDHTALPSQDAAGESQPYQDRNSGDTTSVRIDTAKLDQLVDTVGEMVIAQTLIHHSPLLEAGTDPTLQRNLTQLARTTAELQRIATAMRMVPIGTQFQKTARMVRDLARRFGKQIVFESSGEEAELDKSIAEQLSDPLLHMVRNSIDHGIETPEERIRLGKDPTARIRIAAFHQSGQIGISISDDGRGLDRNRILAKAMQNGLIQPGAQPASDNEIFSLIFEPGFSTAEKVTDTSGRGVGMDVVRKHVQKLRGRIEISSEAGIGTTFLIKLPLTLAIIDGLVVMVGEQRYVAPIFSVREILRPTQEILSTVHGRSEMALVRGSYLPIVRLHRSFAIETQTRDLTAGMLIVTESEGKTFCLFVDRLIGNQEVVIKGLGRRFKDVSGIAGCAILGDGRVGLILDIDGIYQGRV